jgi:hypothetical protein
MPRLLRVLLATAIAAPIVLSTPGGAMACKCRDLEPQRIVKRADAIVSGHVIQETSIDPFHTTSVLAVDAIYEGKVGAQVLLNAHVGAGGGSDCAVFYPVGSRIDPLVLSQRSDGSYVTDTCALAALPQITKLLGEARPPPDGPPIATIAPSAQSVAVPPPIASAPPGAGVRWPAVGGGVLIAVALIVLAVRRSAREPARGSSPPDAGEVDGAAAGGPEPTTEPSD